METYTTSRNLYGDLTNNSTSTNLNLGDKLINLSIRQILNERKWYFLEQTSTSTTTGSTQFYDLPNDYASLIDVTITISSSTYTPREITSRRRWDLLNRTTNVKSDIPEWFFIFNNQVGFYPIPSSSSNTITFNHTKRIVDLNLADYTTGTIATATNDSASITGGSTSWTTGQDALHFRITATAAAKGGDHRWYSIKSIDSTTTLTLDRKYLGNSIATATAAYTIGQVSLIPEEFQQLPIFRAAEIYFTSVKPQAQQAQLYKGLYAEGLGRLQNQFGEKSTDPVVDMGIGEPRPINPNLRIEL